MENGVLWTQINTQLLLCIKVNKQLVKLGKYFADFNFRGSRLTAKYCENWTTRKFPILRYLSILRLSVCQSVSQYKCCFQTSHPLSYEFLGFIYLSVSLNEFFYRLPDIHNPSPPPPPTKNKKILEFIHLSVCLSAYQSVCFFVCIRKQVSITRKFYNHYDEENSTQTVTRQQESIQKLSVSFLALFLSKMTAKLMYKITTNFTT